ncbi:hypothetical protein [Chiayiivirga flava]|uniref:Tetratricopeptide repeat protein n=1 Tax=Chiayiivirga flava TaxID=659595 RepID=A0A7W8D917_9GAMM|nr:hypothetical protein [Chiayiivirga flava]MBB5208816.1 hypothetical protein [Chiayiivirga flava]
MRSRPPRRKRSLACGIALLGLACALPAHADWKRDYDRGLRAFEKENWADAEAAFRAALAEEPTPDARKRFQGVRTAVYVPHYYAGVAAWRQGACERALPLWSNAASTAVVAGITKLDAEQERGMLDCRRKLASAAAPSSGTTAATSTRPPSPSTSPPAASTRASEPNATATAAAASGTAKPAAATPTRPAPSSPQTTQTAPAAPPPPTAAAAAAAPAQATASAAPAVLVTAVEQYLGGQYAALLQLDPARFADGRSRAQAHLLRAAALHASGVLDGDLDARLDAVGRDIRAARAANASLQPDAALFSPRFRAVWQRTR